MTDQVLASNNSDIDSGTAEWLAKQNDLQPQREAIFKTVAASTHWKDPIDTVVSVGESLDAIRDAIIHFTGTAPTFTPVSVSEPNCTRLTGYRVQAIGYRAGPCGDH